MNDPAVGLARPGLTGRASRRWKVAIAGAGTAGLATAAFLARDGHDVRVFEQFAHPKPIGSGLLLQPTGLACLALLGLDDAAIQQGTKVEILDGRTVGGRTIFQFDYRDCQPHLFGVGIHRGVLFNLLHDDVLACGVPISTGDPVTDAPPAGNGRLVVTEAGHQAGPFDLVIDASGMWSQLRGLASAGSAKPFPYGAVWGVTEDPDHRFAGNVLQQRYDGTSVMIGVLPTGRDPASGTHCAAFFWSLPADQYEAWRAQGIAAWQDKVSDLWPEVTPLVTQFQHPDDLSFAHYSDITMKLASAPAFLVVGDAAHGTSPQLGQGANLALLDAVALTSALREEDSVGQALAAYERSRKAHVRFYQTASRWLTPFFQSDSQAASWLRDRTFAAMGRTPFLKGQMLQTLIGVKSGLFTAINPGVWNARYDRRKAGSKALTD